MSNKKQMTGSHKSKEEAFCNLCGQTCAMFLCSDNDGNLIYENEGLISASVSGGYPSTPGNGEGTLDDMTLYTFSLCEYCLEFLFSHMIIPPQLGDAFNNGPIDKVYLPALERIKKDSWRRKDPKWEALVKDRIAERLKLIKIKSKDEQSQ